MSTNDGGPAFPIPNATDLDGYVFAPKASGMSLRGWFAGQALASGLCPHNVFEYDNVAEWCAKVADAMLKEREKER